MSNQRLAEVWHWIAFALVFVILATIAFKLPYGVTVILVIATSGWEYIGLKGHYALRKSDPYRAALAEIRDTCGHVCDEFELCRHRECRDSYTAWAIADAALPYDLHGRRVHDPAPSTAASYYRSQAESFRQRPALPLDDSSHDDALFPPRSATSSATELDAGSRG